MRKYILDKRIQFLDILYCSTVDRNRSAAGGAGGDEVITEYATTRRLDISVGGMSQDEAERYYTKEYQ